MDDDEEECERDTSGNTDRDEENDCLEEMSCKDDNDKGGDSDVVGDTDRSKFDGEWTVVGESDEREVLVVPDRDESND